MATQELNYGTNTFAPAGWSGAGITAGDSFYINEYAGPITEGLTHTGVAAVALMEYRNTNNKLRGIVGGGTYGNLKIDAGILRNRGNWSLNVEAAGTTATIDNIDVGGQGEINVFGGTVEKVSQDGGVFNANTDTEIDTEFWGSGGRGTLLAHATRVPVGYFQGGIYHSERVFTALEVGPDTHLVLDVADAVSLATTTIVVNGGHLEILGGEWPSIDARSGVLDFSRNKRPIGSGLGSTLFRVAKCKIVDHPNVDLDNITYPAAWQRNKSDIIQLGA